MSDPIYGPLGMDFLSLSVAGWTNQLEGAQPGWLPHPGAPSIPGMPTAGGSDAAIPAGARHRGAPGLLLMQFGNDAQGGGALTPPPFVLPTASVSPTHLSTAKFERIIIKAGNCFFFFSFLRVTMEYFCPGHFLGREPDCCPSSPSIPLPQPAAAPSAPRLISGATSASVFWPPWELTEKEILKQCRKKHSSVSRNTFGG